MKKKFIVSEENKKIIEDYIKDYRLPIKDISQRTIENDQYCLKKLSDFLKDKNLKQATAEDLKQFFRENKDFSGYNLLGIKLIVFYRWAENLNKKDIPKRMTWFETETPKRLDTKQVKNEFITKDEYHNILNSSGRDRFGMWQALWETLYLSGARLGEVSSMKIKDVEFNENSVVIYVPASKTETREIPFVEFPYLLERWFNNHPFKENKDAPLWISNSNNNFGEPLDKDSISLIFWKIKKRIDIKQNLSIHNFRKTRFTIMCNQRSKDGGLIYSDSQLALFFGWSKITVASRREQYDLTGYNELKETIFKQNGNPVESYDIVKKEKQKVVDDLNKKIENQEKEIQNLKVSGAFLFDALKLMVDETITEVLKTKQPPGLYENLCLLLKNHPDQYQELRNTLRK